MPIASPAQDRCAAFGIDLICERIASGTSLTAISKEIGCDIAVLLQWLEKDAQRSAQAREVRAQTAKVWDEKAEEVISSASDPFELARAKELAHHYRWRASKINVREYGEKQELTVREQKVPEHMTDDELADIAAGRSAGAASQAPGKGKSPGLH